ncbi:hypothetical protein [Aquimarina sp. Aq78]|nr:hypothetical protein [Aquimarina sp. Aq78]
MYEAQVANLCQQGTDPIDWKYSSARNYQENHTVLKIDSDGVLLGLPK